MGRLHFPRIARLPRFIAAGAGLVLFQNVEDVITSIVTFGAFMGLPADWLKWLTVANITPYARPAVILFTLGMVAWTVWPGGFHPLKWIADWLEEKKMTVLTLGLGIVFLGAGAYLSYRGIGDLRPDPAGKVAPQYGKLPPAPAPPRDGVVGGRVMDEPGTSMGPMPTVQALEVFRGGAEKPSPVPDRSRFTEPLKGFITQGTMGRMRLQALPPESIDQEIEEAWRWTESVGMWICENMGEYALAKLHDIDVRRGSARTKGEAMAMLRTEQLKNLQALVEKDTWDPVGKPKVPKGGCRAAVGRASDPPPGSRGPPAEGPKPPSQ